MTDDAVLVIKESLGFDKCPKCGGKEFHITIHHDPLEKRVDLRTNSVHTYTRRHPAATLPCTIKCTNCGKEWETVY